MANVSLLDSGLREAAADRRMAAQLDLALQDAYDRFTPPDRGCRAWGACLTCPLPVCLFDGGKTQRPPNIAARQRIAGLRDAGHGIEEIVALVGMSRRSVYRHLADAKSARACA